MVESHLYFKQYVYSKKKGKIYLRYILNFTYICKYISIRLNQEKTYSYNTLVSMNYFKISHIYRTPF